MNGLGSRLRRSSPKEVSLGKSFAIWTIALLCLSACDTANQEANLPPPDLTPSSGVLGFINTIPDSPPLTVAFAGTNSGFQRFSLGYAEASLQTLTVGGFDVEVTYLTPTGDTVILISRLGSNNIKVFADDEFVVWLTGTLAAPEVFVINNPDYFFDVAAPPSGSALEVPPQIQFLHGVAGYQDVDIYLTQLDADLATSTPIASLGYPQQSPLLTIDPDTNYQLRVTPKGINTTVLYDSGLMIIALNSRVYVPLVKYFGGGPSEVSLRQVHEVSNPFFNAVQPAKLEIVNLIADEPSVDVYLSGLATVPTLSDVDFLTRLPLAASTSGGLNLVVDITAFNNNVQGIFQSPFVVFPGSQATLYVGGLASDEAQSDINTVVATLAFTDDRPVPGLDRIKLFHGSGSLGEVDVYLLNPGETTTDNSPSLVSFSLGNQATIFAAPGDHDLVITEAGNATVVHGPQRLTLVASNSLEILLSDTAGGGLPLRVDTASTPLTPR